jgi:hypothetical protein
MAFGCGEGAEQEHLNVLVGEGCDLGGSVLGKMEL